MVLSLSFPAIKLSGKLNSRTTQTKCSPNTIHCLQEECSSSLFLSRCGRIGRSPLSGSLKPFMPNHRLLTGELGTKHSLCGYQMGMINLGAHPYTSHVAGSEHNTDSWEFERVRCAALVAKVDGGANFAALPGLFQRMPTGAEVSRVFRGRGRIHLTFAARRYDALF